MPLPMVHIGVAVQWFGASEVSPAFLLGSIAPDAIHMRNGTSRADKRLTHFTAELHTSMEAVEDVYRSYIARQMNEAETDFVKGYFAHILTDYYWTHDVLKRHFEPAIAAMELSNDQKKNIYYSETDQIDFQLYRTKSWSRTAWEKLLTVGKHSMESLLTADEINFWRLRTIHWFDIISEEPRVTPQYITEQMVERFIADAAAKTKDTIDGWDARK